MKLTPSFDQEFCYEFEFTSDTGFLIGLIINLPTWATKHNTSKGDYYFIDYGKIITELPTVFKSKSKITKLLKPLIEYGMIESIKIGRSLYLRASKELVYFWKNKKILDVDSNRSKNRTFYNWNDYVLKMKRIVLKIEPIRTPAISTPSIRTPIDEKENRSKTETKTEKPKSTETWNAYSKAYLNRYRVSPLRGAKVNTLLGQFVELVGKDDAPLIAEYYVCLNDKWFQTKAHDVATMLQNAQAIRTQWATGTNKTSIDYRNQERTSNNQSVQQRIEQRIMAGEL